MPKEKQVSHDPSGHCHCDLLTCISLVFSYNSVSQAYAYSVSCMYHITFKEHLSSLLDCHGHSPNAKRLSLILVFTTA